MFTALANLYHRLLKNHTVEAITSDFTKVVNRLEAYADRKHSESDAHYEAHGEALLTADTHLDNAIAAKDSAREALNAADKIKALVS